MAKKRGFEQSNAGDASHNASRKKAKNGNPQNHIGPRAQQSSQARQRNHPQSRPQPRPQRPQPQESEYHPQAYDADRIHSAANTVPLPPILDDAMRQAVFTHQGTLGAKDSIDWNLSYERLEFLGDAYIQIMSSKLVYNRFPQLSPGRLSGLREILVKNETLGAIAIEYEFDRIAKLPDTHRNLGTKLFEKTMGDIMEAYVAGVVLSDPEHGYEVAETWLTQLWDPLLQERDETFKTNKLAKQELSQKLGGRDVLIQYQDANLFEHTQERHGGGLRKFSVGVYLTGWGWNEKLLGSGEGLNKIEAGNNAATNALANPLIEEVAAIKLAFDAETRAKREREMANAEFATAPEA